MLVPHTRPSATRRPYCYTRRGLVRRPTRRGARPGRSGAAYPYMYPTRRGLWGINDLSLVRGAPSAAYRYTA